MILAQIKIFKEGVCLGISALDGKYWGEYSLVGEKADKIIKAVYETIDTCDPIVGDKFVTDKKKKRRKRK